MAVMDTAGTFGFRDWADTEKNLDGLPPVSAIGFRIEQAGIEFDVLAIIFSERQTCRGIVEEINGRH
ncbi:hypothetical protein ATER59S_01506 [Aquamicrobium terrae]